MQGGLSGCCLDGRNTKCRGKQMSEIENDLLGMLDYKLYESSVQDWAIALVVADIALMALFIVKPGSVTSGKPGQTDGQ